MTAAKFIPALALGMLPLFAQTNAVNVDQVVTLRATLSSLNVNPPVFSTPSGTNPNTTSTGTATLTIRFIGGNSTNTNPVTGTPLPVTGTTTNVSRATVTLSMTPTFASNESITSVQILRGSPFTTTPTGGTTTTSASVYDFVLPTPVGSTVNTQTDVTNATQLATLREIVNNPSAFYLNVGTQSNTSGMLRGQLRRSGDTAEDLVSSRLDLLTRLVVRMAYSQGIITQADRDFYLNSLPPAPVTPTPTNP